MAGRGHPTCAGCVPHRLPRWRASVTLQPGLDFSPPVIVGEGGAGGLAGVMGADGCSKKIKDKGATKDWSSEQGQKFKVRKLGFSMFWVNG